MTDRSKYEALLDVRYGARYAELNGRFYRRLGLFYGFVGIFGGTSVVVSVQTTNAQVALWSGALIAACSILDQLIRPTEKAIDHETAKKRFADLDARSTSLSLEAIDAELRYLQAESPAGIESLSATAYNANLRSNGWTEEAIKRSLWQKLVALLA
jgi:hypothetical protein